MWIWDSDRLVYVDSDTGNEIPWENVDEKSGELIDSAYTTSDTFAENLVTDVFTIAMWERLMRAELKLSYIQQWLLGRGGVGEMDSNDWLEIVDLLNIQYGYLREFVTELVSESVTPGQLRNRSRMYFSSSRQAFEKGKGRALGWPRLPAYPGDGSTLCVTNCRCDWSIARRGDKWLCTWNLDSRPAVIHCSSLDEDGMGRPYGCIERAVKWNPLVIEA